MKPLYAFEALYNNVLLDFTPQTDLVTFNMVMLQISSESRLKDNTEVLVDPTKTVSVAYDLTQLGYDVEQTSAETLHVRWALPELKQ